MDPADMEDAVDAAGPADMEDAADAAEETDGVAETTTI